MTPEVMRHMRINQHRFGPREHRNLVSYTIQEVVENDCYNLWRLSDIKFGGLIDIGANYGIFSAAIRNLWGFESALKPIVAYEPNPTTYGYLTEVAGFYGVQPVACGLGDDAHIWMDTEPKGSPMCAVSSDVGGLNSSKVWGASLDSILRDFVKVNGVCDNLLLKIDCEGAEWGISKDVKELWKVHTIVMELHQHHNGQPLPFPPRTLATRDSDRPSAVVECFKNGPLSHLPGFSVVAAEAGDNEHSPIMITLQRKE